MTEVGDDGLFTQVETIVAPPPRERPIAVPDLFSAGAGVTDEDRTRYGELLDRAAERGLLDPTEYRLRLGELASATTIEEMNRIVSELPVLSSPRAAAASSGRHRHSQRSPATGDVPLGSTGRVGHSRLTVWVVMAALVVVAVVALVFVALSVDRLSRSHSSGLPAPATWVVSPRL